MLKMQTRSKRCISRITVVILFFFSYPTLASEWTKPEPFVDRYAIQVEVVKNQDGSLMIFYIKPNRKVAYIKQSAPNSNNWSKRINLGIYANNIKVAQHKDGRLELFNIGTFGNAISHMTQLEPNGTQWSKEKDLDYYGSQIELAKNADGSLILFFIKPDREIA
jgi:hypothetical protein